MSQLVRARLREMDFSGDGQLHDFMWEELGFVLAAALPLKHQEQEYDACGQPRGKDPN